MADALSYSIAGAASATGVSQDVIRRAIRAGDLPVRYPTSRPVILAPDLEAWLHAAPAEREPREAS